MRAGLVGRHAHDIQVEFFAGDHINKKADIVVVGKIGGDCQDGRGNLWIQQLLEAKKHSKKIVLDYTDHHLESCNSPMGIFYKNILPLIDKSVVSSTCMSRLLGQFFNKEITIIEDPIEIQIIQPKNGIPSGEITFLWFGHATNIPYLLSYLHNNSLCDANFRLIVLSNRPGLEIISSHQNHFRSTIRLDLAEWSLQNMINVSLISHGCLIPSDLNDSRKAGASSNRLITAFTLGLPVTADVLESYSPFKDYFHDIRETPLSVFIKQLTLYARKVEIAQKTVVLKFSQEALSQKWKIFFYQQRKIEKQ